jgi:hypothetical protein
VNDLIWLASDGHDPGGKVRLRLPPGVVSKAIYSPCKQYRYLLSREWSPDEPRRQVMFIMLNPSTATEEVDDPTVRKCRHYAQQWGYNTLLVGNLMAYRSTQPCLLRDVDDPVGPENLRYLEEALRTDPLLICAWGRIPGRFEYAEQAVKDLISRCGIIPRALRLNTSGGPWHPHYLPMAIEAPLLWSMAGSAPSHS